VVTEKDTIKWDGLDDCIIGISSDDRIVYDIYKIINHFKENGMTQLESEEWVDFNILNVYIGDNGPLHVYPSNKNQNK